MNESIKLNLSCFFLSVTLFACSLEVRRCDLQNVKWNDFFLGFKNSISDSQGCTYSIHFSDSSGFGLGVLKVIDENCLVNLVAGNKSHYDTLFSFADTIGHKRKVYIQTKHLSFPEWHSSEIDTGEYILNNLSIHEVELIFKSKDKYGLRTNNIFTFSNTDLDVVVFFSSLEGTIGCFYTPSSNDNPWELILSERGDILKDEIDYSKSKFGKLQ